MPEIGCGTTRTTATLCELIRVWIERSTIP